MGRQQGHRDTGTTITITDGRLEFNRLSDEQGGMAPFIMIDALGSEAGVRIELDATAERDAIEVILNATDAQTAPWLLPAGWQVKIYRNEFAGVATQFSQQSSLINERTIHTSDVINTTERCHISIVREKDTLRVEIDGEEITRIREPLRWPRANDQSLYPSVETTNGHSQSECPPARRGGIITSPCRS